MHHLDPNNKRRERVQHRTIMMFDNPDENGPLQRARFCAVDTMLIYKFSPQYLAETPIEVIRKSFSAANDSVNGSRSAPSLNRDHNWIEIWDPGNVDIEDMVRIAEGIPTLKAGWLREKLEALKHDAGLTNQDLPFMNYHMNANGHDGGAFAYAIMSANGGTLHFKDAPPKPMLDAVKAGLATAGAAVEEAKPLCDRDDSYTSIRMLWKKPKKNDYASFKAVEAAIANIPSVINASPHYRRDADKPRNL